MTEDTHPRKRLAPAGGCRAGLRRCCWSRWSLLFFTGLAAVWPSILGAKLAPTVVEAVNAVLVARLGGNRWLGVAY